MKVLEESHWVWRSQNIENQNINPPFHCWGTTPSRRSTTGLGMILPVLTDTRTLSPSSVYFHSTSVGFLKDRQQQIDAGHGPDFSLRPPNAWATLSSKFGDLKFFNHADSKMNLLSLKRSKVTSCLITITTSWRIFNWWTALRYKSYCNT